MSDELNVWREAREEHTATFEICLDASWVGVANEAAAASIRTYGDERHAAGYQAAIADVVEWLRVQQHGRTSDNYPGYYARQIEQRFGKDA